MAISTELIDHIFSESNLEKIHQSVIFDSFVEKMDQTSQFLQDDLQVPDEMMQHFFEIANDYLDQGRFQDAADAFLFLIALQPMESNLWLRLGNAEKELGHYDTALEAYSIAMTYGSFNPFIQLYSAEVYIEIGELESAMQCLDFARLLIERYPTYQELSNVIEALENIINRKKEGQNA